MAAGRSTGGRRAARGAIVWRDRRGDAGARVLVRGRGLARGGLEGAPPAAPADPAGGAVRDRARRRAHRDRPPRRRGRHGAGPAVLVPRPSLPAERRGRPILGGRDRLATARVLALRGGRQAAVVAG